MRSYAACVLAAAALAAALTAAEASPRQAFRALDVLIENGIVIDGRGGEPRAADVGIADGRILFVGDAAPGLAAHAARRIDAAGRVVAPGFIDLHAHGDPLATPAFENFLAMGVTTIALGQDGASPRTRHLAEWLDNVDRAGPGPNVAMFVGHGTLRRLAGIGREPRPSAAQVARMSELLDDALAVAFGLSLGLEYEPGLHAGPGELAALARVVGSRDRLVASHLRNEDDGALHASIAELLALGEHARVHVSHLKSVYGRGAARADEILALLQAARQSGIEVTADLYPYTASYTGIAILFPAWAKTEEDFARAKRERRDELAGWLRTRVEQRNGPGATLLGTRPWTGRTLAEVAFEREMAFEDLLIDVIGPNGASAAYFVMDEALQTRLLTDPFVAVASDGSPTAFHPRGYGSFARVIEHDVIGNGRLTLAEAVRKMTSLPAAILGLTDRGVLAAGMHADVVVFDPAAVRAPADYIAPHRLAKGFDVVLVNGSLVRVAGEFTGTRAGRVLFPALTRDAAAAPRPGGFPPQVPACGGGVQPGPRTTRPGVAPVCSPSSRTWTPFTNTASTPVAYCCGSSNVA